jgi:heme/copper-type cytochrome/quinol oxidase subunit 2
MRRELKKGIPIIYSEQAVMIIEKLKDFDYDKFEEDYFNQIIIGDQTIWKYIIEKGMETKNKIVIPNGEKNVILK